MRKNTKLTDVSIFTGYSFIGSCREFVWIPGDRIGAKQLPSRFILRGLKCEYDVEAFMIRKDLYLRTPDGKEYIVDNFQITDINDIENVGGVAKNFDLLFEKFPEMKAFTDGEKVVITKKTQVVAFKAISNIIHNVRSGHGIDISQTKEVSKSLVEEVLQAPDAIMNLMNIKSFDDYTFTHNINVSTISLLIGQAMGLSRNEMNELGTGALLHDVGKIFFDWNIFNRIYCHFFFKFIPGLASFLADFGKSPHRPRFFRALYNKKYHSDLAETLLKELEVAEDEISLVKIHHAPDSSSEPIEAIILKEADRRN